MPAARLPAARRAMAVSNVSRSFRREAARLQAAVEAAGQPEAEIAEAVADAVLIEQVNQSFEKGME